jgi:hypothetical protein
MNRRKSLVIAVLFTFCLTVSVFSVIPVSSIGTYDPWLDSNDDGKIDLKDYFAVGKAYGTSGDPTKNVNVTNLTPSISDYEVLKMGRINITGSFYDYMANYSGGYSRIGLLVSIVGVKNKGVSYQMTLTLPLVFWYVTSPYSHVVEAGPSWAFTVQVDAGGGCSYDVPSPFFLENKAPYFEVALHLTTNYPQPTQVWAIVEVSAYLRSE